MKTTNTFVTFTHTHTHTYECTYETYTDGNSLGICMSFRGLHGSKRITVEIEKDNHRLQRYRYGSPFIQILFVKLQF